MAHCDLLTESNDPNTMTKKSTMFTIEEISNFKEELYTALSFNITDQWTDNRHTDTYQGGHSFGGKKFKDFSRTFNQPTFPDPFWRRFTKLFNDGGFRHYLICLVSYKNRII